MSPLTAAQLEHFRGLLLSAKASVEALLNQDAFGKPVEASGPTIGRLSRMDAIQVQAMSNMSRHQLDIRRRQIDASLQAMDRGIYGLCRECKQLIHLDRLEALPEAPFCMPCQESFEV
ncbi:MAG: TraR/DksA C4-type zinc finger protein [Acidobacteriota bacterium]